MAEGQAAKPGGRARIGLVGDIVLGRRVTEAFRRGKAPEAFWGNVRPELQGLDAVVGNLEGAITTTTQRYGHGFKAFHFCADPGTIAILSTGNLRCVATANNHILDGNPVGLADTIQYLDAAGIAHAGSGPDIASAFRPTTFKAGTVTFGFASITNTVPPFAARTNRAGTAFTPIRANALTAMLLRQLVAEMTLQGAEVRILSIHWGPNFRPWPPRRYRAFARMAIDEGFDIVHGHSAHILQALEYYRDRLILYDTGDFMEDFWVMPGFRSDRSFLFEVEAAAGQRPALRLLPVSLTPCEVNFAKGAEADTIRERMTRRCRGYNASFTRDGDALLVAPANDHDSTPGAPGRSTASASSTA
jgi:poly-gamma-glutamate synthesis protein (capsule biosynthesis protein)